MIDAEKMFREAIRLDANLAPAYFSLCLTLIEQERVAEANLILKEGTQLLEKSEWKDWATTNMELISLVLAKLMEGN